ncbi:MAG: 16S rRNA pseudouridine(516) synthase [Halomonadaceae bacterium]|nr:MAG: 16S rRNA pseudouridine(516) synthase [Halomonadaceae bacterium]
MRLDYFLAHTTAMSRKEARQAVARGQVRVTGMDRVKAATAVSSEDQVWLGPTRLQWVSNERYLMLNKPLGVICATQDAHQSTVLDCLPETLRQGLHPVGRLDKDSSGLLLLTNDGQWSHRVSSPAKHQGKVYRATLASGLTDAMARQLGEGLMLKGESRITRPAVVEVLADNQCRITLSEGRYHQVRRMLAAVGNHVQALHREAIGGLSLDPALAPGEWRELTAAEVAAAEGGPRA